MKRPLPYSIGRRLSLQLALQTALGLFVILAIVYGATAMLFKVKHDESLSQHVTVMSDLIHDADREGGRAEVLRKVAWTAERRPGTYLELLRSDGSVFYRDALVTFDPRAPESRAHRFEMALPMSGDMLQGRMVLDCSQDAVFGRRMALVLGGFVVLGGVLAGWGSFYRVRCGLQPLVDLANQLQAVDVRGRGQRLSLTQPAEELLPLVDQFNGLMLRVQETYAQLEGFNADVAHELRTPLTTLMGQTEVMLSRERSVDELTDTLASNLEELQRIAGIVNDMLFLAQADRGTKARRGQPVRLAEVVNQVVEFHEAPLEDAHLRVNVVGDAHMPVDEALVKRALSNLLGNAIRYARPGTVVTVGIEPGEAGVRLWVENEGPPIAEEHLPRLFDRFFRADPARSEVEKPHHGLGLSIVAAIARMHDGSTQAQALPGGTRIGFSLR